MAVYLGNRLVLANGVAGTSLANGHAEAHAAGGGDEITPQSIGAAAAAHTHEEYAAKPVAMTVTLPKDGWNVTTYSCAQAISVNGMRAGKHVLVGPSGQHWGMYTEANVRCTVQGYNALAFTADRQPTGDIDINMLINETEAGVELGEVKIPRGKTPFVFSVVVLFQMKFLLKITACLSCAERNEKKASFPLESEC